MTSRAVRIQTLRERLQQLEAAEKQAEQRARVTAAKRQRQTDTRRKILLGAYVLDRLGAEQVAALEIRGQRFSAWLTRTDDRALFDLAPLVEGAASAAPASLHAQPPCRTEV